MPNGLILIVFNFDLFILRIVDEGAVVGVGSSVARVVEVVVVPGAKPVVRRVYRRIEPLLQVRAQDRIPASQLVESLEIRIQLVEIPIAVTVEVKCLLPRFGRRTAVRR